MATYNRPGVYVNELPLAAAPVNGAAAATSAGAVLGAFPQGPDVITKVTSWYDFTKKFGGYNKAYPASFSVGSFFKNGGTELYVKRILPAAAKKVAKVNIPSEPIPHTGVISKVAIASGVITFTAGTIPAVGATVTVSGLSLVTIGENDAVDLNGTYTVSTATDTTFTATTSEGDLTEATNAGSVAWTTTATICTIGAKHRGLDGNNLRVKFAASRSVREAGYYDVTVYVDAGVADSGSPVTSGAGDDVIVEQFNGVVLNDPLSGDYLGNVLSYGSSYITLYEGEVVEYQNNGSLVNPTVTYTVDRTDSPLLDAVFPLSGAPTPEDQLTYADYTGNTQYNPLANSNQGSYNLDDALLFKEFEVIEQPLVFFLPDVATKVAAAADSAEVAGWPGAKFVYNALIDWIENVTPNNFVVVETAGGENVSQALSASGDLTETSRGAVYYPHVYIKDPLGRSGASIRKIGPAGAVVGTYLATDREAGPFKAPAGIGAKVSDAVSLERAFSPADLDALNSGTIDGTTNAKNVVNAVRNVPGAGIVIMGGRTLKQDGTANRYVNMRRSLTYLEKRLTDLASFAVFENNSERLWARLVTVLGAFLNEYRNQGGLRGSTIEQSYYIKCDEENNNATTIGAGEVHIEIGVALEYPAEFVVINLSQKTAE